MSIYYLRGYSLILLTVNKSALFSRDATLFVLCFILATSFTTNTSLPFTLSSGSCSFSHADLNKAPKSRLSHLNMCIDGRDTNLRDLTFFSTWSKLQICLKLTRNTAEYFVLILHVITSRWKMLANGKTTT